MTFAPFVIVTATTEIIRDRSRVRVNEAYTDALAAAGLIPVILPPIDAAARRSRRCGTSPAWCSPAARTSIRRCSARRRTRRPARRTRPRRLRDRARPRRARAARPDARDLPRRPGDEHRARRHAGAGHSVAAPERHRHDACGPARRACAPRRRSSRIRASRAIVGATTITHQLVAPSVGRPRRPRSCA